jgi:L-lactate dehydrogenase complex protein LldG
MPAASSPRELMLRRIRKALSRPLAAPFLSLETQGEVYPQPSDDLSVIFATEFTRLLGQFAYCADEEELCRHLEELQRGRSWANIFCRDEAILSLLQRNGMGHFPSTGDLMECDASLTRCEALVARTGSMLLSSAQTQGRTSSVYAPIHVCIAWTSQLVYDISDAIALMKTKYGAALPSAMSLATGPSRTADIEKTLVVGVHGPKEVYCFLVED